MKKSYVYMLWGYRVGGAMPEIIGLYKVEDHAYYRFAEEVHGEKKLNWHWLNVKKMEVQ